MNKEKHVISSARKLLDRQCQVTQIDLLKFASTQYVWSARFYLYRLSFLGLSPRVNILAGEKRGISRVSFVSHYSGAQLVRAERPVCVPPRFQLHSLVRVCKEDIDRFVSVVRRIRFCLFIQDAGTDIHCSWQVR